MGKKDNGQSLSPILYVKWYLNPNGLAEATISAQTSRGNKLDATATLGAALDRFNRIFQGVHSWSRGGIIIHLLY